MNSIISINVHLAKLVGEFSFIMKGHGFNSLEQQYFLNIIIELGSELGSGANLFAQDAGWIMDTYFWCTICISC